MMCCSFAAGCTDGNGPPIFTQGTTEGKLFWDTVRDIIIELVGTKPPSDYYDCHDPKPVLLPTACEFYFLWEFLVFTKFTN